MKNKGINYPHPVLNEYSEDYLNSKFSLEVVSNSDNGSELTIEVQCNLESDGLLDLINKGEAEVILRIMCHRTSYRFSTTVNVNGKTIISVEKNKVADRFRMQAMVVATKDLDSLSLPEFNPSYFRGTTFSLRKGDILADQADIWVQLDTLYEPNVGGIVQITCGEPGSSVKASFADESDENPSTCDYIYVRLPDETYRTYSRLKTKKYLKTGVERFLQCSVVLPALIEGISKLRYEESTIPEEGEPRYRHTVWGESIYAELEKRGIFTLDGETKSDYELANMLLGDVIGDSINNLMTKANEWSRVQWEDMTL